VDGSPLTSAGHNLEIKLWSTGPTGGTALCDTAVPAPTFTLDNSGRFSTQLDDTCIGANAGAFVEILLDGNTLGRTKLGAVPYAIEANHAVSADTATTTGMLDQQVVPSGAVMAFSLAACPAGWSEYTAARARTVVGTNPTAGSGLSAWTLNQTRGEEQHTQTVAEMPSHTHTNTVFNSVTGFGTNGMTGLDVQGGIQTATAYGDSQPSSAAGSGSPFNVIQPSIALLYCKKN
jgi:hypothetical protein